LTIYIDQMFFENFIMNFIILYIVSKFLKTNSKWYRLSIGASIGAIYVILSYIMGFYSSSFVIPKIILSIVIVISSFRIKSFREFFKILIFFYSVTFFIGGISFGLAYFFNISIIKEGGVLYVEEFPIIMVAFACMLTLILGRWIVFLFKNKANVEDFLYEIEIRLFDKKISTKILMDSGNNVKEPFTGYPVLILENEILKEIVPIEIILMIKKDEFILEDRWKKKIRIIPVSTINLDSELKVGFKLDEAIIHNRGKIENLIVVGCDKKLSKDNEYHGLIGNVF